MNICIITPDYLTSTPRVVKEADALSQAGHQVRVVYSQGGLTYLRRHDEGLLSRRSWRADVLRWSRAGIREGFLYGFSGLRQRFLQHLPRMLWGIRGVVERVTGRLMPELASAAARERADLYIGHYPAGLGAAAAAASRWGSRFAYDAEDLYAGEGHGDSEAGRQMQAITCLEKRYAPSCAYISASSRPIADELVRRYAIRKPIVIANAFPFSDRERLDHRQKIRRGEAVSLYWFSQTVGPHRGLEDAFRALGLVRGAWNLHIQGAPAPGALEMMKRWAAESKIEDRVHFHDPVAPNELLSRAAEHDIGLALEQPVNANRALCATNKLFLYLLAGLAVAATRTPGQDSVLSNIPGAMQYAPGDVKSLAAGLQQWIDDPSRLAAAKAAALNAARETWNWESESRNLVAAVAEALS